MGAGGMPYRRARGRVGCVVVVVGCHCDGFVRVRGGRGYQQRKCWSSTIGEGEDEVGIEAAAAGCKRRGSTPCAVEVDSGQWMVDSGCGCGCGCGECTAAKPKPVFKLSGVCVSNTAGAAALSVMLLSGKVLPWERRSNVSPKRRPTKPRQSQCRLNVFSRGS